MRKFLLIAILLLVGGKYGWNYLLSEDFQKYGDAKKAQWTCHVNNFLAGLFQIGSEYQRAHDLYDRVLTRCPETPLADEAMYQKACTLEDLRGNAEAMAAFDLYRQTFPQGNKIKLANEKFERLKFSR